jgi:fumarylacetoacetase
VVVGARVTDWGRSVLPYGVFSVGDGPRQVGVAVDDGVLPLEGEVFAQPSLNAFLTQGRAAWDEDRAVVQERVRRGAQLLPLEDVELHLPFEVADYVDFYSSERHATDVGRIFRPDEPLLPHWKHLPIGYHGRAGTVVVSGTDVVRPSGLRLPGPEHGPSRKLDLEVEVGFVVGAPSELGRPVPAAAFRDHVFGLVLVNDWSARDIQSYEYRPLGPFLGKSFATSISPWVVPLAALEGARVPAPVQDPQPAEHLRTDQDWGLDLSLELVVNGCVVSRPPFAGMYWTPPQQLAHLTSNGASLRTGDLYASGTVSGDGPDERGCLLELTWDGRDELVLSDGSRRTWLEDGDEVVVRGRAGDLPLGEVVGRVSPAR